MPTALPWADIFDAYGVAAGYLNRFLHHQIMPQAKIASTPELGSGTVATRKPKLSFSLVGLPRSRPAPLRPCRHVPQVTGPISFCRRGPSFVQVDVGLAPLDDIDPVDCGDFWKQLRG